MPRIDLTSTMRSYTFSKIIPGKGTGEILKNLFNSSDDLRPMNTSADKPKIDRVLKVLSREMVDKSVSLRGWVHRIRWSKNLTFIILRDPTGIVQCTVKNDSQHFQVSKDLTIESCITVQGVVKEDERAPGGFEVVIDSMEVIGKAQPFPISEDQSTPLILDNSHLWLRSREMTNVLKITHAVNEGIREYFHENGFYQVDPPILITAACEGGSTLFSFDYFGKKAYLTQSSQLYLEAFVQSLEKVYCSAPSFRAEKSRTKRHLTEFWHLEAEEAFCDLWGSMQTQEEMITHIAHYIARERSNELRELGRDPKDLEAIEAPFEKIPYEKAVSMVQDRELKMEYGEDFGVEHERVLVEGFEQPFFIHSFANSAKAFYHRPDPKNPEVILCADLLAPEGNGEIIGGGERIHKLDLLLKRINEAGLDPADYEWYLDLRRYGTCPHAGFGLGVARLVKWFCKLDHIRQAVPFPRTINRIYP